MTCSVRRLAAVSLACTMVLAAASSVAGCATSASTRPDAPPSSAVPAPRPPPTTRLPSGLRVVLQPATDGVASAALLIGGGPLDDPIELPGLSELVVEAAVAGTLGDETGDAGPEERALALGAALDVVADGRVFGWLVRGPADSAVKMLTLLHDVVTRPSFPATRVDILIAMAREAAETGGSGAVDVAVAIAAGAALGLGRGLPLQPTPDMLERVNREDVMRQWRGVVRPERAVLVLRLPGVDSLPSAVAATWGAWRGVGEAATSARPCIPLGQQLHRVESKDAARSRSIALMATAVPSSASPERVALDALALWLGEEPGGPIEAVVGIEDAHRSRPWLLDLGWNGGRGAAVMLTGVTGDNDRVTERVQGVAAIFARHAAEVVLDADEAAGALRAALGLRRSLASAPVSGLVELGARALYGSGQIEVGPQEIFGVARRHLAPHQLVLTVVGQAEMARKGEASLPETRWSGDGKRLSGPKPVRCVPEVVGAGAERPTDSP